MHSDLAPLPWIIGISGASGSVYARRLMHVLLEKLPDQELDVVISEAAFRVMREEEGLSLSTTNPKISELIGFETPRVRIHHFNNIGASIASGSYRSSGMVIVPCSMATLGALAHGTGTSLLHRAADVMLKEKRPLIIVPRETPLSAIHLENMLRLAREGVKIVPAMPGFYHQPQTLAELVEMQVMKVADQMGLDFDLVKRWGTHSDKRWRAVRSV